MKAMKPVLWLLAAVTPSQCIQHISDIIERIHSSDQKYEPSQQLQAQSVEEFSTTSDVQTLMFDQRLDHFTSQTECHQSNHCDTFQQRYFYTSRFVHREDGSGGAGKNTISFLCVGGEGPSLDESVLIDSVHCTGDMIELASKLYNEKHWNIHLFALEHRYYGESHPDKNKQRAEANLRVNGKELDAQKEYKYLSSRQAVQDIIQFVQSHSVLKHINDSDDAKNNVRWITFGGSYPGMLAAWSRLLHPDLIFGAVANSAPVQAEVDFRKYNDHVALDLGEGSQVGGSKKCLDIFESGHAEVASILEGGDVDEIDRVATAFNVCDGSLALMKDRKNIDFFVGYSLLPINVQSNDPTCDKALCNIQKICDAIIDEYDQNQSSLETLAKIGRQMQLGRCKEADYQLMIDYFSAPSTLINSNDRSWYYQTCTEFGFYQTCENNSRCPYAKGHHSIDLDLEICQKCFGINTEEVKASIKSTLAYYGGWNLMPENPDSEGQKRLIFVNGSADPWSELSVNESRGRGNVKVKTMNVLGASHHFWTHAVKESDDSKIFDVRKAIYDEIYNWLGINVDSPSHYVLETE